jgi:hypothetical protein
VVRPPAGLSGSDIIGVFKLYGTTTWLAYAENGGRWF